MGRRGLGGAPGEGSRACGAPELALGGPASAPRCVSALVLRVLRSHLPRGGPAESDFSAQRAALASVRGGSAVRGQHAVRPDVSLLPCECV